MNPPVPKPPVTPVKKSWIITRDYVQISNAVVVSLNAILATSLTIVTALTNDQQTLKIIGIAFGSTITILNILTHLGLQIALTVNNAGNQAAEQKEENFINDGV